MYKRLFVIALVPSSNKKTRDYTLYLFEKKEKYVVPIEFTHSEATLLLGSNPRNAPNVYNTTKRLIHGLGGNLVSASIYKHDGNGFYTYLNVVFQDKHLEFNTHIADAINIVKRFEAPIYIKTDLLDKCGIKVSRQILRDALNEDF